MGAGGDSVRHARTHSGGPQTKDAAIEKRLECSLEELYHGATRKLRISRQILDGASGRPMDIQETLTVDVRPGWKKGTRVTFPQKGAKIHL